MTIKQGRKRFIADTGSPVLGVNRVTRTSGLQRIFNLFKGENRRKPAPVPITEQLRFW